MKYFVFFVLTLFLFACTEDAKHQLDPDGGVDAGYGSKYEEATLNCLPFTRTTISANQSRSTYTNYFAFLNLDTDSFHMYDILTLICGETEQLPCPENSTCYGSRMPEHVERCTDGHLESIFDGRIAVHCGHVTAGPYGTREYIPDIRVFIRKL